MFLEAQNLVIQDFPGCAVGVERKDRWEADVASALPHFEPKARYNGNPGPGHDISPMEKHIYIYLHMYITHIFLTCTYIHIYIYICVHIYTYIYLPSDFQEKGQRFSQLNHFLPWKMNMFDMLGLQFLAFFEGGLNWKSFQRPLHWWLFLVSLCRLVSNNASREIEKGFGDIVLTPTGLRISRFQPSFTHVPSSTYPYSTTITLLMWPCSKLLHPNSTAAWTTQDRHLYAGLAQ